MIKNRQAILTLLDQNWSYKQIEAQLGVSSKTISKVSKERDKSSITTNNLSLKKGMDYEVFYNIKQILNLKDLKNTSLGTFGTGLCSIIFEDFTKFNVICEEIKYDLEGNIKFYFKVNGLELILNKKIDKKMVGFVIYNSCYEDKEKQSLMTKFYKSLIKELVQEIKKL